MAPSLVTALTSVALFSAAAQAASYQLADTYNADNFLQKFNPFVSDHSTGNYNDVDPTSGYVSYKSAAEAQDLGILKTIDDEFFLGVDANATLDAQGVGRSSVRLESKDKYNKGLFIADFSHLPKPTCGTWPAFWTVGLPWPKGGEIDIYEAWNLDTSSRFVMHTDASVGSCGIDGKDMTAEKSKPNCAGDAPGQGSGEGCAALDPTAPYASSEGGVYAMEWTSESVKIWAFTHDKVPADLTSDPNPDNWGAPRYRSAACEVDKVFDDAQLILNIGFCGVAGHEGQWDQCAAETGEADCQAYVANNPEAFASSFFQVRSIKVYQKGTGETPRESEEESETPDVPSYDVPEQAQESISSAAPVPSDEAVSSAAPEQPEQTYGYPVPGGPDAAASSATPEQPESAVSSALPEQPEQTYGYPVPGGPDAAASSVAPEQPQSSDYPVPGQPESAVSSAASVQSEPTPVASEEPEPSDECPAEEESSPISDLPQVTASDALPVPSAEPPAPTSAERLTTLTITQTAVSTITSCPPEAAAECPGLIGSTTVVVVVTTTVCPLTDVPTTLTVSRTIVETVTDCEPDVPQCPGRPTTKVETQTIVTTTEVPVIDGVPATSVEPVAPSYEAPAPSYVPPTPASEPAAPSSEPPVLSSEAPVLSSETPVPSSEPPVPTYEPPAPTYEPPVPASEPVAPSSEPPASATESSAPAPQSPAPTSAPPVPTTSTKRLTTLTITETTVSTITSCPPEAAAECPGQIGSTTEIVVVTTTVCPVTDVPTTLTISRTIVETLTECPPEVPDCPGRPTTKVETETIVTSTEVPVIEPQTTQLVTQSDALPVPPSPSSDAPEVPGETPSYPMPEPPVESPSSDVPAPPEQTESDALPVPPVTTTGRLTTLTISETVVSTITACAPEAAAECPGLIGSTTQIVVVTTTVCPVTDVPTTLTISKTIVNTITSCPPETPNCPGVPTTIIETEIIETTTPVPVFETATSALPEQTLPDVPPATTAPPTEQPTPEPPVYEQPETPETPATPEQPVPEQPVPEQPGQSETPETPGTPEQPGQSETPETPVTPEQPVPEQPEQPTPEGPISQTAPFPPTVPTTLFTESFVATFTPPVAVPIESLPPFVEAGSPRLGGGVLAVAGGFAAVALALLL